MKVTKKFIRVFPHYLTNKLFGQANISWAGISYTHTRQGLDPRKGQEQPARKGDCGGEGGGTRLKDRVCKSRRQGPGTEWPWVEMQSRTGV